MKNLFFNKRSVSIGFSLFALLFAPFVNAIAVFADDPQGGGGTPESIEKTIKEALKKEIDGLQASLKVFKKSEDIDKELNAIRKLVEDINSKELETKFGDLEKAAEAQGLVLKQMQETGFGSEKKTIETVVREQAQKLTGMIEDRGGAVKMSVQKDILTANTTNDRSYFSEPGVREIQRGMPWLRNLLNVVTLGPGTHGSIDWWEQLAVTNNASVVAEGAASTTASNLTWVRKTLDDKILNDHIKVSKDRLKDVDFIAGEVRTLIERNMRLLENTQILKGTGLGNNIKGMTGYAQAFATAGIQIPTANLNDMIGKIKTQIKKGSLDGFMPSFYACESALLDEIRFAKDEFGQYIFPMWAQGMDMRMQGLTQVENNLIDANTLLVADGGLATLYEWDSLVIEVGYVDKDFINNMVTINARMRENLRIKDNDVQGFVYVDDVATTLDAITQAVA